MSHPSQWTVPPEPPGGDRPIRGRKVAAGIGLAALGQVLAISLGVGTIFLLGTADNGDAAVYGVYVEIVLQVLLFLACLIVGIVWIVNRDRGLGLGLIIGWAVSVLVFPVVGVGVCIAVVNAYSGAS